jgi:hypothetical protein
MFNHKCYKQSDDDDNQPNKDRSVAAALLNNALASWLVGLSRLVVAEKDY